MRTTILVFTVALFLGVSLAAPQQQYQQQQQDYYRTAYITRYDNDIDEYGRYSFNVETSDGFNHRQSGDLRNPGTDDESIVVQGEYSYQGPDGVTYRVEYTADENGFQPAGAHLPPSAGVRKLGIPSAALASLAGGGLG